MNKIFLLALLFVSSKLLSQSIYIEPHLSNVNENNSTSMLGDLGTDIKVRNISSKTINIKVSRQIISVPQGTINYFCWTACYGSSISVSPDPIEFLPGQENENTFQVHFDNMGIIPASASIKYCAFNAQNIADSACTIVNYSVGVSSIASNSLPFFSGFHPNPTSSTTHLEYVFSNKYNHAKIIFTDMLGNVINIKKLNKNENVLKFDVGDTPNGLYFANIYINGNVVDVKRLVINR